MSQLYEFLKTKSKYYDKNNYSTQEQYDQAVRVSSTVYVGNLHLEATQDSIKQLFSRAGKVKKIIMGINNEGHGCGFCFVIFSTHEEAERAVDYISQTKLNSKIIRVDLDPGYIQGRQKGRGRDGNQKRDDFRNRNDFDRSRNKYQDRYRGDRRDRGGDRFDRADRFDRGDRGDRGDKYQRSQRYDRGDRGDRGERGERGERNNRRERNERDREYGRQAERQEADPRKATKQDEQKQQEY